MTVDEFIAAVRPELRAALDALPSKHSSDILLIDTLSCGRGLFPAADETTGAEVSVYYQLAADPEARPVKSDREQYSCVILRPSAWP